MMLRCTWLVPPAMRPPGAAEQAGGVGAVEHRRRRRPMSARSVGDVEHHLGDAELEQRAAGRGDRPALVALALGQRLVRRARGHQRRPAAARSTGAELALGAEPAEAARAAARAR